MSEKLQPPYTPTGTSVTEFTFRALIIALPVSFLLGAANAYLGLRAGMTIAATYPAAVISMAFLRLFRTRTLLEENFFRTVGSIGESVAAGAIFTIPAFVILGIWNFETGNLFQQWAVSSALMILGGLLGIMFVTILRRVMVEDKTLTFPESVAAAEIHRAGQRGGGAAMQLFSAMGVGALIKLLGRSDIETNDGFGFYFATNKFYPLIGKIKESFVRLGIKEDSAKVTAGGVSSFSFPAVTPAYLGVGYIIGPELGALNFAGGLLAWGLFVPLLVFFLGPGLMDTYTNPQTNVVAWGDMTVHLWKFIVRPIAVGGMLVGACYTLFRMRKNLAGGIKRGVADVRKAAAAAAPTERIEQDLSFKLVLAIIGLVFGAMCGLYYYFTNDVIAALVAAVVILITGFFFAAVSGNLVGMIGSSNNPISGLTLATTIVAALTMVIVGATGPEGIAAVLGVAAVGCVSAAVAGEMLQDLKVGHILKGTPWKMQVGDIIGVVFAGLLMFWPLYMMHTADVADLGDKGGFGGKTYAAPQAGLMAALSQGIVGGEMAWPLVVVGIVMGFAMILIKVKSPMLFSVGMYLPLETTFAIFVGGIFRWIVDKLVAKRGHNDAQKARVENAGILTAAGLIAGEALIGLVVAVVIFVRDKTQDVAEFWHFTTFDPIAPFVAIPVFLVLALYMIFTPLRKAGAADEPAPPTAVM